MAVEIFHALVNAHIMTGSVGLVAFWGAIGARKGGEVHRVAGRLFALSMASTGVIAALIAATTLSAPLKTHPSFDDAALVGGIFGWMMLYLAVLTLSLAAHGWLTATRKSDRAATRAWWSVALQILVILLAANCAVQGVALGQPLMMGIAVVGLASGATNLVYLFRRSVGPLDWLLEHIKSIVGAGISVYTAFLAFGAVRLAPELALNPGLWALPLIVGLSLILYHQRKIAGRARPRRAAKGASS